VDAFVSNLACALWVCETGPLETQVLLTLAALVVFFVLGLLRPKRVSAAALAAGLFLCASSLAIFTFYSVESYKAFRVLGPPVLTALLVVVVAGRDWRPGLFCVAISAFYTGQMIEFYQQHRAPIRRGLGRRINSEPDQLRPQFVTLV
jgi:hypothetical protein